MIYVMRSSAFNSSGGHETIIKIGYTGEKSHKARFNLYLTENPTIKVLYLIPFGSKRDEKNLHRRFKQYLLYGNEWFKDVPEIIEFFDNHKTKESLKELEKWKLNNSQKRKSSENRRDNKDKISLINISVNSILNGELDKTKIEDLENYLWYRLDDFWDVISDEFGEYENRIREIVVNNQKSIFLSNFISEFEKDNNFVRRMKLLCDTYFQYPEELYNILIVVPLLYQNYINLLGFEKIRALSYQESTILKYLNSNETDETGNIDFSDIFSIGSKYPTRQIKSILADYYTTNSISKTPKASDLEEYFNLKPVKIKNESGKWEHGFEIISKKEGVD